MSHQTPQLTRFHDADTAEHGIIARSKVVLEPGTLPTSIVIREVGSKFVTHKELHAIDIETTTVMGAPHNILRVRHLSFESGHYFDFGEGPGYTREQALRMAIDDFNERRAKL